MYKALCNKKYDKWKLFYIDDDQIIKIGFIYPSFYIVNK